MTTSEIAKKLGRKGGIRRAQRLSKERLQEIARSGAKARIESLRLAKVIQRNFSHLDAIQQLSPPPSVISEGTTSERLPGLYAKKA